METIPLPITTAPDPAGIAPAARAEGAERAAPPRSMTEDVIGVPRSSRAGAGPSAIARLPG